MQNFTDESQTNQIQEREPLTDRQALWVSRCANGAQNEKTTLSGGFRVVGDTGFEPVTPTMSR